MNQDTLLVRITGGRELKNANYVTGIKNLVFKLWTTSYRNDKKSTQVLSKFAPFIYLYFGR
jgi:hypothetical protein